MIAGGVGYAFVENGDVDVVISEEGLEVYVGYQGAFRTDGILQCLDDYVDSAYYSADGADTGVDHH